MNETEKLEYPTFEGVRHQITARMGSPISGKDSYIKAYYDFLCLFHPKKWIELGELGEGMNETRKNCLFRGLIACGLLEKKSVPALCPINYVKYTHYFRIAKLTSMNPAGG